MDKRQKKKRKRKHDAIKNVFPSVSSVFCLPYHDFHLKLISFLSRYSLSQYFDKYKYTFTYIYLERENIYKRLLIKYHKKNTGT